MDISLYDLSLSISHLLVAYKSNPVLNMNNSLHTTSVKILYLVVVVYKANPSLSMNNSLHALILKISCPIFQDLP